ncbi:RNA-dependent RNA polymerase [Grapevine Garan dmak virus]|uniref:RNA-directed RNA polymerase L n=1 Tax=Grapevine Garan dmak virus TaxID=2601258 RepID=A0A5B8M9M8_9VIRU|nr:RNA-dependent RNA polymerase [Grapevine Garan dmak virus]QDZ17039.1 RNA-dependent RNA polymerase [Grapevine Garan dmak virus]
MKTFESNAEVVKFWKVKKGYIPRHMLLLVPLIKKESHQHPSNLKKIKFFKQLKSTYNIRKLMNVKRDKAAKFLKNMGKSCQQPKWVSKRNGTKNGAGKEENEKKIHKIAANKEIIEDPPNNKSIIMIRENIDLKRHNSASSNSDISVMKDPVYSLCNSSKQRLKKLSKEQGFCFLNLFDSFEDKYLACNLLGKYPSFASLLTLKDKINMKKKILYNNVLKDKIIYHAYNETSDRENFKKLCHFQEEVLSKIIIGGNIKTLNEDTFKRIVDLSHESVFVENMPINFTYFKEGNYIKLKTWDLEDNLVKINLNNPNFIHDCVLYAISGNLSSDMKTYGMTPDIVLDNVCLEITTSSVSDEQLLIGKLQQKVKKYAAVMRGRKLIVVVVSYDTVVSNYKICESAQMGMTTNFCILKKLQSELLMENKYYWSSLNGSKFERKLNSILENYELKNNYEGKKEAFNLIDKNWEEFNYDLELKNVLNEINEHVHHNLQNVNFIEKNECSINFPIDGRTDLKRITVVPMFTPLKRFSNELIDVKPIVHLLPGSKLKIIQEGMTTQDTQNNFLSNMNLQEILSGYYDDKQSEEKKGKRKGYQFKPSLNQSDMLELNLDGIMAKEFKGMTQLLEKRAMSKIPFSSKVDTGDIEDFRMSFPKLLTERARTRVEDEAYSLIKSAYSCMIDASVNMIDQGEKAIREFDRENETKFVNWMNFVNDLMFEINLSLRENTKNGYFIVKSLRRFHADVYIKTTNSSSHIFFFVVCKPDYVLSETLGPKFVCDKGILVSDWGSMLKRDLENYLSMKETIRSTFSCYDEIFSSEHEYAIHNAKWLSLMIFLSNKDRNEETISSLRYTYMKSLSLTEFPSSMNKKLNLLFRDRLQVYLTLKVYELNNHLSKHKPKITHDNGFLNVFGLKDLFGCEISFKEAINISYAGYIMTKVKQPQSNQSSKMIEKILEYEIKFLKVTANEISVDSLKEKKEHCFDYKFVRTFSELGKELLVNSFGNQCEKIIKDRIVSNLEKIDFESISTLKASAKMNLKGETTDDNLKELKSARPRVISNVMSLINKFNPEHYLDLVEPCIKQIVDNDCFNVELFPKDQHNGLREIYVVDIHVRIVQLFIETISRSLCSFFQSETLNHPKNSTGLIPKTLKYALDKNESPFCLMKSGDASKWSQSQIVTKFYIVFKTFLPKPFHKIIKDALSLWFDKKIFLPPSLIEAFMSTNFATSNNVLNDLRDGKLASIKGKGSMFMHIKSGFMQGILHHTSSLFHTIVQEGFRQVQFKILKDVFDNPFHQSYFKNLHICILQGSDDSSMAIMGDTRLFNRHKELFLCLMHLKDLMSYKFGIIPSVEKTATCVPFIIEYNSQWLALGKSIQPTIKFAMVACQLPSAQSIIQRQEFYYNLLKDCLEKGCSTYTCFKIKLNQLCAYYNMLGCNTTSSFQVTARLLKETLNPSLGFFILEPIVATAVFGFDFSFYCHTQGAIMQFLPYSYNQPLETDLPAGNTLRLNTHISKTSWKKWNQLIKEVGILTKEEEDFMENCPALFYDKSFNDVFSSVIKMKQKCQDFDVKQSLSSRYGITENMASFFCTFIKVCKIGKEKDSLVGWMVKCTESKIENIAQMFPKCKVYDEIIRYISVISDQSYLVDVDYVQRCRSQITVLHNRTNELELFYDTVRHVWFDFECDEITKNAYKKLFTEYMSEFDWLRWTEKETKIHLNCSSRQLANYIRNVVGKNRTLTFYDTVAKGSNYPYLLTRIFQKNKKIQVISKKDVDLSTNDIIFSNMKILLNLPYKESFKMEVLESLIPKLDLSELTSKEANKYKMLSLVLNGEKEKLQNELFKYSFDNHISWYSQAQHFNKESKSWEGLGCLTTIISTLTIKTIINDSVIEEIIVNDLEAFKANLDRYLKIIKEHKLELNEDDSEILKLSRFGISSNFKGSKITISFELKSNITFLKNCMIALTNGNIKLIVPMIDANMQFSGKRHSIQTLYLIENERRAKTIEERRKANSLGKITEEIWIDSRSYNRHRCGEILKTKMTLGGKDVKTSTIMNFEIWKKITLPTHEELFEWGDLGRRIVHQESLNAKDFVIEKLNEFPNQLPVSEIFQHHMENNHFDGKEYLNFVSKVEFFQHVTDPEYDDVVKKDSMEELDNALIEKFNKLIFNSTALTKAMNKSVEFNSCLINLENILLNTQTDFSHSKHLVYGIKDTETTFPNTLFYKLNHELRRLIPDEEELLSVISCGDESNLLDMKYKVALNLLFSTPLSCTFANTVKSLREFILLGYKPESSRSSRSSTRLGIFLPNNEMEHLMLKKFKLHPKMRNIKVIVQEEINELKEAIEETSANINKTKNKRVKLPLITQIIKYEEDLELIQKFNEYLGTLNLEDVDVDSNSEDSTQVKETDPAKGDSLGQKETMNTDVLDFQGSENFSEELTHSIADSQESVDGDMSFDLLSHLKNTYYETVAEKENVILYFKVDYINYLQNPKIDIENNAKIMNTTLHVDNETIFLNQSKGLEIYWPKDGNIFHIFSHAPLEKIPHAEKLLSKKIKPITPAPGGSCLFNAISYLLAKQSKCVSQEELRRIVYESDHMSFLDIEHHRKTILDNGVWGQEEDLEVLCHELNFSIVVFTHYDILIYNEGVRELGALICFNNIHFDVIE